MPLTDDLKKVINGDVLIDGPALEKYSHDASLFEILPKAAVCPKDTEDVKNLVRFASQSDGAFSLTARSGGTDMSGGALTESVVVDFSKYFNQIKSIGDGSAVVEPGVFYRDFEKATLEKNLLLPTFPASRDICTVGGMVANNAGGEKTLAYGKTEDYILQLKAVLADGNEYSFRPISKAELDIKTQQQNFEGEVYRKLYELIINNYGLIKKSKPNVSKNSAGYYLWNVWDGESFDLTKLLVGSQGTLGLVTEIKFRLIAPKPYSQLAVIFLKDLQPLVEVAKAVMHFQPESFESFDDHTLKLVVRFLPSLIRILRPKNIFKLFWQFLPEMRMTLTGGFPKLVLLAEFTGDSEEEISRRLQDLGQSLSMGPVQFRIITDSEEMKKYWTIRRESFNLLRKHIKHKRTAPFIDDFIVRLESLPEFLPKLNAILDRYQLTYTIAGHVGDANFHIIPLMDLSDPGTHEVIEKLSDEVYNLVLEFKGSITAEHNDGLIRSPYLKKMYGEEIYRLFEETKKIFDPKNIFNPGKKVGASLQYAFDHLVKSS